MFWDQAIDTLFASSGEGDHPTLWLTIASNLKEELSLISAMQRIHKLIIHEVIWANFKVEVKSSGLEVEALKSLFG